MKTSPKTSAILLATLALGASTAGSIFSESLQTNVIGTIGSAGAFFPDREFQMPAQQSTFTPVELEPDYESDLIALPIQTSTMTPALEIETQVRTMTSSEVGTPQTPSPKPSETPQPLVTPETVVSPSPEASPEVSASQTPVPQPSELISAPE